MALLCYFLFPINIALLTTSFTMVGMGVVHASNTALVQNRPLVAVFFGGTSGIGHYTLRALATAEAKGGKGFRAYIVGRNAKAAEEIIEECCGICPQGHIEFVQTDDISLIQAVDRACAEILQLEEKANQDPRIDYMMLSQGGSIFLPRKGRFKLPHIPAGLTDLQTPKRGSM